MAYNVRLTKKGSLLLGIIGFLILGGGLAFAVIYLSNRDTQVAPDDSEADAPCCCPSFECSDGRTFGMDSNWCGDCSERHTAVNCTVVSEGNECSGTGDNCGGLDKQCCPGAGCGSSLHCIDGICVLNPGGGSCNGQSSCDNFGCYCNPAGNDCNATTSSEHCLVPNPSSIPSSCNENIGTPEDRAQARAQDICKVIQYDIQGCNGTNANVVWIDDDGTRCSSNDGGLEYCLGLPGFSFANCGAPPPEEDSCSITVAAVCKNDSAISNDPLDDGVSADITWNVSNATFDFGPTSGKVVLRINDLANGWFTEGFDTWWATNYQEFITAGGNAAGDTWNFDIRTNAQGVSYDSIKDGENYEVWATAYTTPTSETGICESTKVTFKCESDVLQCNDSGCTNDSQCGGGLICHDGKCRNPECPAKANCVCPIIPTQSQCDEACTTDDECSGALICSNGRCREQLCTEEADCICPTGSPVWRIAKDGAPVCVSTDGVYAEVFYNVVVRNSGDQVGTLVDVVDTLDSKVQSSWVNQESISNDGQLVGNTIVWTLTGDDATFDPGEELLLSYSLNIPNTSFGEYTNIVVGNPISGEQFSAQETVNVTCLIPVTGIFDETEGKLLGAVGLIVISVVMLKLNSTDRGVLAALGRIGKTAEYYSKDSRVERTVSKHRDEFEKDMVKDDQE